jgi:hypothetical protein
MEYTGDNMPVIITATVSISKSLIKYLDDILGVHFVKELLKTAILRTEGLL